MLLDDKGDPIKNAEKFNDNISNWNVSVVTSMGGMFQGAAAFNQPLEKWDVSKVKYMSNMFRKATAFDESNNNILNEQLDLSIHNNDSLNKDVNVKESKSPKNTLTTMPNTIVEERRQ
jgi:surface protein